MQALDYHYSHGAKVLHQVTFELLPGKLNVLVGPSGSGKSTLAELILGLRPATKGKILLDGQNIHELSEDDLRKATSLVSADGVLFSATLKENLCYQVPGAGERQAWEALKAACLDEWSASAPGPGHLSWSMGTAPFRSGNANVCRSPGPCWPSPG